MRHEVTYTKRHIAAVEKRLQQYEDVLASEKFVPLGSCQICNTANSLCRMCLLSGSEKHVGCEGTYPYEFGVCCKNKKQQRAQFNHLLRRLDECGYEWR